MSASLVGSEMCIRDRCSRGRRGLRAVRAGVRDCEQLVSQPTGLYEGESCGPLCKKRNRACCSRDAWVVVWIASSVMQNGVAQSPLPALPHEGIEVHLVGFACP
eukprot:15220497-Alexandrium_andersonii.AAC.1